MMPHVDDGTLHALLDGALRSQSPERAAEVGAHLEACEDCRARLRAAEALRGDAAAILASTEPETGAATPDFAEVRARSSRPGRAAEAERVAPPSPAPRRRRRAGVRQARWTRGVAWAASLVLALGTGYLIRDLVGPHGTGSASAPETSRFPESRSSDGRSPAYPPPDGPPRDARSPRSAAAAEEEEAAEGGGEVAAASRPEGTAAGDRARQQGKEPSDGTGQRAGARADDPTVPPRATGAEEPVRREDPESRARDAVAAPGAPSPSANAEAAKTSELESASRVELEQITVTGAMAAAARAAGERPDQAAHWSVITLQEAREALDGPLYLLPRARLIEISRAQLDDDDAPRVLTLQRLETGAQVRVIQWRGEGLESESATGGAAVSSSRAPRSGGDTALPDLQVVRVVRGPYVLELTGSLPRGMLSVLGEVASPAP